MGDQYRLVDVGNSELLAGLSALVRQSNVLTAQVLAHLVELEERMLPQELGYGSLFTYCVEVLGMSEGSAGRRVAAAKMCKRFPEAFEQVARGELHLCALCALAPHVTPESSTQLFEACRGKTRRKIEELLAARFPRPDVREQIRRLPARAPVTAGASEPSAPPAVAVDASIVPATPREVFPNSLHSTSPPVSTAPSTPAPDPRRRAREKRFRTELRNPGEPHRPFRAQRLPAAAAGT